VDNCFRGSCQTGGGFAKLGELTLPSSDQSVDHLLK
jgi:hypothetical protein